jgi:hypothetical protein
MGNGAVYRLPGRLRIGYVQLQREQALRMLTRQRREGSGLAGGRRHPIAARERCGAHRMTKTTGSARDEPDARRRFFRIDLHDGYLFA